MTTTHSGSERDTPAPPRRVIDLELDDGDDDWEDLATPTQAIRAFPMKVKDVRQRMLATSTYKMPRKPSLYNAKISVIMADLNAGSRLTIPEVKAIVKDDLSLLEGYTTEEEVQMLADLEAKAQPQVPRDLNGMAQRANMVGFAMFSRGHLHDTSTPTTISTKGGNTLRAMQKECTDMILTGLMAVTRRTKIAMNYENYISSMVEGKNVGLVGWPQGVAFKTLRGLPVDRASAPTERERILKNFEDMVEKGERRVRVPEEGNWLSEESSEEDESGGKQASKGDGVTVRQKLLALVEDAVKKGEGKGKATSNVRFTKKARAPPEDTSARHKKKRHREAQEDQGRRQQLPTKKRKKASNTDGEPPTKEKHKKASAEEDDACPPRSARRQAPVRTSLPRLQGKAKAEAKASCQEGCKPRCAVRSVSPTPRSPAASTSAASPKRAESASAAAHPLSPAPRSSAPRSPAASIAPASQVTPARPMVKGKRGGPPGSALSYTGAHPATDGGDA
ncbi:hypothetical protein B0H14DRAFT_3520468 [Mycena olivaceomarginata]|nr:hypothetical protein B0H14DRAFT_3520468 [Mycena olivaceomarginata]